MEVLSGGVGGLISCVYSLHGLHEIYSTICDLNRISESFLHFCKLNVCIVPFPCYSSFVL